MCKPRQWVTVMETGACAVKGKVFLTAAPGDVPLTWWSCWVGSLLDKSQSFCPLNGGGQELGFKPPENVGFAQPLLQGSLGTMRLEA